MLCWLNGVAQRGLRADAQLSSLCLPWTWSGRARAREARLAFFAVLGLAWSGRARVRGTPNKLNAKLTFIRLATAGDTRRARIPKAIESWFYSPVNFVLTLLVFWWTGKLFWWTNKLVY